MIRELCLYQITAPYYCAGLETVDGIVVKAAPIIKWTIGKDISELFEYFKRKRFKITKEAINE